MMPYGIFARLHGRGRGECRAIKRRQIAEMTRKIEKKNLPLDAVVFPCCFLLKTLSAACESDIHSPLEIQRKEQLRLFVVFIDSGPLSACVCACALDHRSPCLCGSRLWIVLLLPVCCDGWQRQLHQSVRTLLLLLASQSRLAIRDR